MAIYNEREESVINAVRIKNQHDLIINQDIKENVVRYNPIAFVVSGNQQKMQGHETTDTYSYCKKSSLSWGSQKRVDYNNGFDAHKSK